MSERVDVVVRYFQLNYSTAKNANEMIQLVVVVVAGFHFIFGRVVQAKQKSQMSQFRCA